MNEMNIIFVFLLSLLVSGIIIYFVTRMFGASNGILRAIVTALIGTIVYTGAHYIIETSWIAPVVAGIVWIVAISFIYKVGFLKSAGIGLVIWIFATVIDVLLPTVSGPL